MRSASMADCGNGTACGAACRVGKCATPPRGGDASAVTDRVAAASPARSPSIIRSTPATDVGEPMRGGVLANRTRSAGVDTRTNPRAGEDRRSARYDAGEA
jgi:hypothetical protein